MEDLRLIAFDDSDLQVISSLTQDAIIVPTDISFDSKARHFIVPMRRYAWEAKAETPTRKNSVVRILNVEKVQSKGLERSADPKPLSLLTMSSSTMNDTILVSLTCANNISIILSVEALEMELQDLGASWSASRQPNHGK